MTTTRMLLLLLALLLLPLANSSQTKYMDFDNMQNRVVLACESSTYDSDKDGDLKACSGMLRPTFDTMKYVIDSEVKYQAVQLPYRVFYKGLRAPEGMVPPADWGSFIDPGAVKGACMPQSSISTKAVKCWLGQSTFTMAQSTPWVAGQPSRYSVGVSPGQADYLAPGMSTDCLMTGENLGQLNLHDVNETCVMCVPTESSKEMRSCPNGMVADNSPVSNKRGDGVTWGSVNCNLPCEAGTWLTCQHQNECKYIVPSMSQNGGIPGLHTGAIALSNVLLLSTDFQGYSLQRFNEMTARYPGENQCVTMHRMFPRVSAEKYGVGEEAPLLPMSQVDARREWMKGNGWPTSYEVSLSDDFPMPSRSCYPCSFAEGRMHYGKVISTGNSDLVQQGFLKFYCSGGGNAPLACPVNMVSKIDPATNKSSACNCMNGFYKLNDACVPCKAGFKCSWNGQTPPSLEECPTDYFATDGQTACRQCTTNYRMCSSNEALTRCQRDGKRGGTWQTEDAHCVSCQICQQVAGNVENARPCFRVTAVYNATGGSL